MRSRRCVWARTQSVRGRRADSNAASASGIAAVARSAAASTSASSSAIAAPWAMFGEVAWAASPISTTRSSHPRIERDLLDRRGVDLARTGEQRRGRVGERLGRGPVPVAIGPLAVDRHGQERRAARQHHRPRRDLRRARREEAPAGLAECARRRRSEGERAHAAVDPVGADHDVVVAAAAVAELDGRPLDARHGQPAADGHVARRLEQQRVQVGAVHGQARPDARPQPRDVDLAQQPAAVVAEALPRDLAALRLDAERAQRPHRVAGEVEAGAGGPRRGVALDHLDRGAVASERSRQRQPGDAGAGDQHALRHGRTLRFERNRLPGS